MYSTVRTAVLDGISAIPVQVEVDNFNRYACF